MAKTAYERDADIEISRQLGILPDLKPQLSLGRKVLVIASLLLALSTTLFGVLFHVYSASGGHSLQASVTQ